MSQITFKTIEKKINRKNSELKEVVEARKKLEDREKELSAEIEKLQTQKVEIIFEQVKKVVKNEKLDITSESVNPILEILREGTIKAEEISSDEEESKKTSFASSENNSLDEEMKLEEDDDNIEQSDEIDKLSEDKTENFVEQLGTVTSKIA